MKEYNEINTFGKQSDYNFVDKELFNRLIDLFTKSNLLLNIMYQDQIEKAKVDKEKMVGMSREKQQEYKLKHRV